MHIGAEADDSNNDEPEVVVTREVPAQPARRQIHPQPPHLEGWSRCPGWKPHVESPWMLNFPLHRLNERQASSIDMCKTGLLSTKCLLWVKEEEGSIWACDECLLLEHNQVIKKLVEAASQPLGASMQLHSATHAQVIARSHKHKAQKDVLRRHDRRLVTQAARLRGNLTPDNAVFNPDNEEFADTDDEEEG
mmetsp:Transcript_1391/g.5150  ORF Transcript_1391/g.5150 Transcript_1391/m.5150 type:complete len:192 (-) Transcript_1391:115-690(-)